MQIPSTLKYGIAALSLAGAALTPTIAAAQSSATGMQDGKWQFAASIYAYLPTLSGNTTFPGLPGNPSSSLSLDAGTIIDNLKMVFMGSLDMHNGQWGLWNDVLYMNLGNTKNGYRDFTINGAPTNLSGSMDLDQKSTVWTIAGEYRLATGNPAHTVDLLAGARMLDMTTRLGYSFSGTVGSHPLAGRSGSSSVSKTYWDGIIGVKGNYAFGANREWFVPYYADIGTGSTDLTYQVAAGIGYKFGWGELTGLWRYMDYNMKSGQPIQSLNLNGPQIGATWRW